MPVLGTSMMFVTKHRAPKGALRPAIASRAEDVSACCHKAPSAKRCIKTCVHPVAGSVARHVTKHRAPKGALRLNSSSLSRRDKSGVTKHRAPKGALRPILTFSHELPISSRHKAPSAKRCIKTRNNKTRGATQSLSVTKHRAPKGALRHLAITACNDLSGVKVTKHRAPKGALRPDCHGITHDACTPVTKHRAPKGALRPSGSQPTRTAACGVVTKHRAPKGALRRR